MPSVVVHGHFYQPSRCNAWSGEPDLEESAAPAHDWNERINAECYRANAWARIHAPDGQVLDLVNNYEWMSFNFGPTVADWLERRDPATYARILDADRRSLARTGHGNAMAQAYNHAILPLCNERDRRTQVRWGIDDFKRRFGRKPEGMWLSECAVDYATIDELAKAGVKFTILSPEQAAGPVDPSIVYRCRGLAIFFFDGPISREISFSEVSKNGEALAARLATGKPLTVVATDGEVYGHHKKFADLTLAYVLARAMSGRGIEVTNPAAYLAKHRDTPWISLRAGASSWSCPHGVERWRSDCGCSTGGPAEWNQKWRTPLRDALDWLRDRLAAQFESEGRKHFGDPWAARDQYLVTKPRGRRALELLEVQRHAMMMYTSCAWFFADLSGIEVGLVVQHAFRAIELSGLRLKDAFLQRLAKARSNLRGRPSGASLAKERVLNRALTPAQMAWHAAAQGLTALQRESYSVKIQGRAAVVVGRPAPWTARAAVKAVPLPPNETHDVRTAPLRVAFASVEPPEYRKVLDPLSKEAATRWIVSCFRGAPSPGACRTLRRKLESLEGLAFNAVVVQNAFHDWIEGRRVAAHAELLKLAERLGIAPEAVAKWVKP